MTISKWFAKELFFRGMPLYGISNGVMWAIFVQIQVYIVMLFVYPVIEKIRNQKVWLTLFLVLLSFNLLSVPINSFLEQHGFHAYPITFLPYAYFFFIGVYAFQYFNNIVLFLVKYRWVFLIAHVVWHLGFVKFPAIYQYTDPITVLTASAAALGFAYSSTRIKIRRDISYDIFIWHMPIYTAISSYLFISSWTKITICIILTILLSFITNKFVEEKLK